MTVARVLSVALFGVQGHLVEIEAYLGSELPGLTMIGLPDAALQEARDRIRAAIVNSGEAWPNRRIVVSLSPASEPKRGSSFDLALAAAVLLAARAVPTAAIAGRVLLGELGLDGRVRPIPGVLPAVLAATAAGVSRVVVPSANAAEAALVPGVEVVGVSSLRAMVALLRGTPMLDEPEERPVGTEVASPLRRVPAPDLADVLGQLVARRAVEIAAAGGHHMFLHGPPGAGKTMLAERLPGLLPQLDQDAALEVTAIHSVAGLLPAGGPLITRPPFAGPHHTASVAAIVGGGSGLARPGAASLAHRGVLFLDEAPEFRIGVLDSLRQPLESGEVVLARSGGTVRYPARFILVLAANPCACSRPVEVGCSCSAAARHRYRSRLSGPLLDRVDLIVRVDPVSRAALLADRAYVEPTPVVAARVAQARERMRHRLAGTPWRSVAEVPGRELRGRFAPTPEGRRLLEEPLSRGLLSSRGLDRALRVAWTLADLAGRVCPGPEEVGEALALRLEQAA